MITILDRQIFSLTRDKLSYYYYSSIFIAIFNYLFASSADIEINFKPESSRWNDESCTVKDVLQSIPGFSSSKIRNKKGSNKKLSLAAAIQLAHDGFVDLESPESILSQVNMRSLLNKSTFMKPEIRSVDQISEK